MPWHNRREGNMESKNHQEKNIICYVCKICMQKTELKNVYKCPACHMIEEKEQEKREGKKPSLFHNN